MFYAGARNVPGAPGNVGTYEDRFAGLNLPIPGGRLNRGGDLRNQTRPGGQTETLPTRPMLPSDYGPAFNVDYRRVMGLPGVMQMGNMAGLSIGPQAGQIGQSIPPEYVNKIVF